MSNTHNQVRQQIRFLVEVGMAELPLILGEELLGRIRIALC